jgi:hypothetical protein
MTDIRVQFAKYVMTTEPITRSVNGTGVHTRLKFGTGLLIPKRLRKPRSGYFAMKNNGWIHSPDNLPVWGYFRDDQATAYIYEHRDGWFWTIKTRGTWSGWGGPKETLDQAKMTVMMLGATNGH